MRTPARDDQDVGRQVEVTPDQIAARPRRGARSRAVPQADVAAAAPVVIRELVRAAGRGDIDLDHHAARVQEVWRKDERDPMALLEPTEQTVARLLAHGKTNEQIAAQLGFQDKRTISRVNGQIYAAWGLAGGS